jgi:uncharacterized protein YaaQ
MKLVMSVVGIDDASELVDVLTARGFTSTLISSTGGFLKKGNDTLLIGVPDEQVDEILSLINETCHPHSDSEQPSSQVKVGAATVFVMDVDQHETF